MCLEEGDSPLERDLGSGRRARWTTDREFGTRKWSGGGVLHCTRCSAVRCSAVQYLWARVLACMGDTEHRCSWTLVLVVTSYFCFVFVGLCLCFLQMFFNIQSLN